MKNSFIKKTRSRKIIKNLVAPGHMGNPQKAWETSKIVSECFLKNKSCIVYRNLVFTRLALIFSLHTKLFSLRDEDATPKEIP